MRKPLLTAMIAMLAVTAFGVGPAMASAETVSITNESGEPLEVGSVIEGVSESFYMNAGGGTIECESVKLSGEVTANQASTAAIDVNEVQTENCAANVGVGFIPYVYTRFDMPGSIEFSPGSEGSGQAGGFSLDTEWWFKEPSKVCHSEGSPWIATWQSQPGQHETHLNFAAVLHYDPAMSATCAWHEEYMYVPSMLLTGSEEQPIEIVTEP